MTVPQHKILLEDTQAGLKVYELEGTLGEVAQGSDGLYRIKFEGKATFTSASLISVVRLLGDG